MTTVLILGAALLGGCSAIAWALLRLTTAVEDLADTIGHDHDTRYHADDDPDGPAAVAAWHAAAARGRERAVELGQTTAGRPTGFLNELDRRAQAETRARRDDLTGIATPVPDETTGGRARRLLDAARARRWTAGRPIR